MAFILTILAVFILLVISEVWWRHSNLHNELGRKFVHITVGSFVAFWPYWLSPLQIKILSLAFLLVVAVSRYLHIFQAIHSVQRPTWGEFWFALTVGLLAFTNKPHIFTAALLVMSLADGLAAVIGTSYGMKHRYSVMGSPKTIAGTATFFVIASLILMRYFALMHGAHSLLIVLPLAAIATILENIGINGLDNLLVPVFIAAALTYLG